jgi:hypothetical protein
MEKDSADQPIFAIAPDEYGTYHEVTLLIRSLRTFGGKLANQPIWVCLPDHLPPPDQTTRREWENQGALVFPLPVPADIRAVPFASKVFAAAHAETLAARKTACMAWLDADTLFLGEPTKFLLAIDNAIGCRPVMLKNVSAVWGQALPEFWRTIYTSTGIDFNQLQPVTSIVDNIPLYPHYNAGCLSIHPNDGCLQSWRETLIQTCAMPDLQRYMTSDSRYAIFLHQATLSAVICGRYQTNEILDFGDTYNIPPFLKPRFPEAVLPPAQAWVSLRYDDYEWLSSGQWRTALPTHLPFYAWLEDQLASLSI